MILSPSGDFFLKNQESEAGIPRLTAYRDSGGVWTIGWGHTGPEVVEGLTCSVYQAQEWFARDIEWAVKAVNDSIIVPLAPAQFDSLVSLCFNIGADAFKKSTLVRKLNNKDYLGSADEFLRWNKDNGQVVDGLSKRRDRERKLFLSQTIKDLMDAPDYAQPIIPNNPAPIVESKPVIENPMPTVADAAVTAISVANPIVGAGLQILRSLWPELSPLFKSGQSEVAARNTKAAEAVLTAVVQATGAPNVQAAVEAVQADPAMAQAGRQASFNALTDFGLVEVAGGISEARKVAAQSRVIAGGMTFIEILALVMMLLSAAGGAWVLVDPLDKFGDQIRAMVITAMFIGGWTGIQAFFFGSSSASRSKDATIAAQSDKGAA